MGFEGLWGMSLNETLLILALILILVDIFFLSDIPTHLAYILLSWFVARQFDVHLLYRIVIGILAWFCLVAFHYALWKKVLARISNRLIAPTRYRSGTDGIIGKIGTIKTIEKAKMVSIYGELWNYECVEELSEGQRVEVVNEHNGVLNVNPYSGES